MKITKNQKIVLGSAAALAIGVIAYKKMKGGSSSISASLPEDSRLNDPETKANALFLKQAYDANSQVKFISTNGTERIIPKFKTWLDAWMIKVNIASVNEAIINRAHWQGAQVNRLVTVNGLGSVSQDLLSY